MVGACDPYIRSGDGVVHVNGVTSDLVGGGLPVLGHGEELREDAEVCVGGGSEHSDVEGVVFGFEEEDVVVRAVDVFNFSTIAWDGLDGGFVCDGSGAYDDGLGGVVVVVDIDSGDCCCRMLLAWSSGLMTIVVSLRVLWTISAASSCLGINDCGGG